MVPTLNPGQFVIASFLPYLFSPPKVNDLIIFKSDKKFIIKRIIKVESEKYKVEGDNTLDSKDFGEVDRSKILGKVLIFW
ncbi:hypothetical protein A3E66_05425 [Candidatus Daviesbacteria bacterium RIFCSPHIGHO2_12_FULL_37_16]|uniref:Peptidase S26 domain-containing protein n=2 Tax=Candidatus Daviesiibacteriota TaxID=1752718 RepID=A0A1F5K5Z3_9BACT|nr:MAG: hypothetical protein US28_C0012G0027 [Candidatus Daviesbacteria bacterium GW2011_GWA1_36_8]OGE36215.1 MAG: hypothetical protein A3E66_05425 [Candidatus Daviesbacteria bacterium RIFCSPHIGHO2_12_FULL_37_16]